MNINESIQLFEINTDAVAVNRGYYYQYLVTLKKWIDNYINKKNNLIYCEVDDDIKEVGNSLTFTQVKCYSRKFSLHSDEIKKSLFNYFILYLKNKSIDNISFCFTTNTAIADSEKLLKAWINNPNLSDKDLANKILQKIQAVLNSEINKHKRKKLERKKISTEEKEIVKQAAEHLKAEVASLKKDLFLKGIKWEFLNYNPDSAINVIFKEVRQLLSHEKFKNKPASILESVLLSEIFRCSQMSVKEKRVLTNSRIDEILNETDLNVTSLIDERLISLLEVKFEEIEQSFKNIHAIQIAFEKRLDSFEVNIKPELSENKYPKHLTLISNLFSNSFHGRTESIDFLYQFLSKGNLLCINGNGGSGKTSLVSKFVNLVTNEYDHIAWINSSPNLLKSILLNHVLLRNLNINFNSQLDEDSKIDIIINVLQSIKGNNLLIIDNYENDLPTIRKIVSLNNWKILITTRERVADISNYTLPKLDITSAIRLYSDFGSDKDIFSNSLLVEFFEYVNYNPLIIKICGQTISNSVDLGLQKLFTYIKEQDLDKEEMDIEINITDEEVPQTILVYLLKKFKIKHLSTNEENFLEFLALLPSEDVNIKEIALIGGEKYYKSNLKQFTNWSNSLHNKGWIERNGEGIRMNRLIQQTILYNVRTNNNGFISNVFMINWLFHRIDEVAQSDPTLSFPFLKYAESILKSIKEQFRASIYQPLLLLENALLNSYNWIENSKTLHNRWIDLVKRAENYLPNNDINLGIIYNNLGHSYTKQNDVNSAIPYFQKSIATLKKHEEKSIDVLINSFNNLTQAYLVLDDLPSAQKTQKKINQLLKKHTIQNKQYVAVKHCLEADYFMRSSNYPIAIEKYEMAIKLHLSIEKDDRNDILLLIYYSNLILMLFKMKHDDRVMENISRINEIIKRHETNYNSTINDVKIMVNNIRDYYNNSVRKSSV